MVASSSPASVNDEPLASGTKEHEGQSLMQHGSANAKGNEPAGCDQDVVTIQDPGNRSDQVHIKTLYLQSGKYDEFICDIREELARHEKQEEIVVRHPLLAYQLYPKAPKRWMYIKLVVDKTEEEEEEKETTLAIRDDNLYLIGFQGKDKKWYEFGYPKCNIPCGRKGNHSCDGDASMMEELGATFLGCGYSYIDLLGVPLPTPDNPVPMDYPQRQKFMIEKMVELGLGKVPAIEAVGILSRYEHKENGVDSETKRALVRLILMFCEATRMIPFYNTVLGGWSKVDDVPDSIKKEQAIYIWNWKYMSQALREWKKIEYTSWGPTTPPPTVTQKLAGVQITNAAEALGVIQVLVNVRHPVILEDAKKKKRQQENQADKKGKKRKNNAESNKKGGGAEDKEETDGNTKGNKKDSDAEGKEETDDYTEGNKDGDAEGKEEADGNTEGNTKDGDAEGKEEDGGITEDNKKACDAECNEETDGNIDDNNKEIDANAEGESSNNEGRHEIGESSNNKSSEETTNEIDMALYGYLFGHRTVDEKLLPMVGLGRPLAEVLRVRAIADSHEVIRTISVFDGKRGQIIYMQDPIDDSPSQPEKDLLLTGPFKAISAEGSFAIQLDGIKSGEQVRGDMLWDCYSDDTVYNQVLEKNVSIGKNGSIAKVTYVVLSDAVEATVQIQLRRLAKHTNGATARVYGTITVRNQHYAGSSLVLFSRSKEEEIEVKLQRDSTGMVAIPVPLARSVVAAPLDMPLLLQIEIYAKFLPDDEFVRFEYNKAFYLLREHSREFSSNELLLQVTSPYVYPRFPGMSSSHVCLDLDCRSDGYGAFIEDLRDTVADHMWKAFVHGRPVLAKQKRVNPARFIMITLAGDMNEKVTLALRDDNLDLVGFMAQSGSWYELDRRSYEWDWREGRKMLPGSTFLGCTYSSLVDGSHVMLQNLRLGRRPAMSAIRTLSGYTQQVSQTVDQATKVALAGLIVMICESARLGPIYDMMKHAWVKDETVIITHPEVLYMLHWSEISRFLLGSGRLPDGLLDLGIKDEAGAAEAVRLVHNPRRPLMEVYGLSVQSGFRGIISIIDDQGSEVIAYKNPQDDAPSTQGMIDLALLGPYRPVSADGKVRIQCSGKSDLILDGREHFPYPTRRRVHLVTLDGFKTRLTYVLLPDAVEASVMVELKPKQQEAGTVIRVFGEITATNHYDRPKAACALQLFSRAKQEAIQLDDGVISVPLLRGFLGAPLNGSAFGRLDIKVNLSYTSSSYEHPISIEQDLVFLPDTRSTYMKEIDAPNMKVQVTVTTAS